MTAADNRDNQPRTNTGIAGLDWILHGGLPDGDLFLVEGPPGSGKTTLGLQFLIRGAAEGKKCLHLTVSQTDQEVFRQAERHGWDLNGVTVVGLPVDDALEALQSEQSVLDSSHAELLAATTRVGDALTEHEPDLVVFDSVSQLRLLAGGGVRYRRQLVGLRELFLKASCTVILINDDAREAADDDLRGLVDGIIRMSQEFLEYGSERRRLVIEKMRGTGYVGGFHDMMIRQGGLVIFPRITSSEKLDGHEPRIMKSGIETMDQMVGGGLVGGSACLLIGPAGVGKSTLATQYVDAAAKRGERSAVFILDERMETFVSRAKSLGIDLRDYEKRDLLGMREVRSGFISPGEFAQYVRSEIEQGARIVVIDSLTGYLNSMPHERFLLIQMHELLAYCSDHGVLTLLILAQHGLVSNRAEQPVDVSYMADTIMLLRHYENESRLQKSISIFKRRMGAHDNMIRDFKISSDGIMIGDALLAEDLLSSTPVISHNGHGNELPG